jgi:hypothetical protein
LSIQQTDGQEIILEQDPELPGFYGFPLRCRVYLSWQSHYAEKCYLSSVGELPLRGRMQLNLPQASNELLLVAQSPAQRISFQLVIKGFETPKISHETMAKKYRCCPQPSANCRISTENLLTLTWNNSKKKRW